jgi:hypothetical protein
MKMLFTFERFSWLAVYALVEAYDFPSIPNPNSAPISPFIFAFWY